MTGNALSIHLPGRLRIAKIEGKGMDPILRGGRDYALVAPCSSYEGDWIYLLTSSSGGYQAYRVMLDHRKSGHVVLYRDNPAYSDISISWERFNELVLARVVADIKVRDPQSLRNAAS